MQRVSHGSTTPPSTESPNQVLMELGEVANEFFFPVATAEPVENPRFTYLYADLARDDKCVIPETDQTLKHLSDLGEAMRDKEFDPKFDSLIPAAYTYFAQFVNHDISFTEVKKQKNQTDFQFLASNQLGPWTKQMILKRVSNKRSGMLELDCLYGRMQGDLMPPRDNGNRQKMALGKVSKSHSRPKGKDNDDNHDLVRGPKSQNLKDDRTALIGDRRNDSNIILSQLHVAFLRAHNAIVDRKNCTYEEAKDILQKHYHWLILKDFLPAIVPDKIIEKVINAPRYDASRGLPLEFSVGAFRFGHSMIRRSYYLNDNYQGLSLAFLNTSIVLANDLKPAPGRGSSNITEDRIIQWRNFLAGGRNVAREFRTQMVEPLFELLDEVNIQVPGERSLAVQDLKRAYMMRIPTGQVIAKRLEVNPLTPADIEEVSTPRQFQILKDGGMLHCTPLSFYVLAEAAKAKNGKLGEVGSHLVAEVLIALLRNRPDSIIDSGWEPEFGAERGTFFLSDLLRLGGVLEDQ